MNNTTIPYHCFTPETTKIDSYSDIVLRKDFLKNFFLPVDSYKTVHKQTLIIFIYLLQMINDNKFEKLSQKELAHNIHVNESTVTRAMKWLESNNIIEVYKKYGKQFKLKKSDIPISDNLIDDFKNYSLNTNKYFIANLYFHLVKEKLIECTSNTLDTYKHYYDIANELRRDKVCKEFFNESLDGDSCLKSYMVQRNDIISYVELLDKFPNKKKELLMSSKEHIKIGLVTQGNNFTLIQKDIILYFTFLYEKYNYDIPKPAVYIFLYLLTKLDSYHYIEINRRDLINNLNIDKSTASIAFKWLESNSIIEYNPKKKKECKFKSIPESAYNDSFMSNELCSIIESAIKEMDL